VVQQDPTVAHPAGGAGNHRAGGCADLTQTDPPGETTHWTAGMMAKTVGISVSSVQRIWRAHGLQPDRVRQFKLSSNPQFATKVCDIVGLLSRSVGARHRAVG
jgi:hypothetical protein